jgi:hypothetical protein
VIAGGPGGKCSELVRTGAIPGLILGKMIVGSGCGLTAGETVVAELLAVSGLADCFVAVKLAVLGAD